MEYGFSCMGYEVAGALGIKLANPEQEVYALVGDGSFVMLHSELLTSIQEGQKINVLLFDNHGFQCIHNLQRENGSEGFGNEFRKRSAETGRLNGDFLSIDFAAYAGALGVKTYRASTLAEMQEALKAVKKEKGSTLIDIKVLPGTNTHGYESWWQVGVAEVSTSEKVQRAYAEMQSKIDQVKGRM